MARREKKSAFGGPVDGGPDPAARVFSSRRRVDVPDATDRFADSPTRHLGGGPGRDDGSRDGTITFRVHIGVAGHRDIRDEDEISRAVHERLTEIRRRFPATGTTRLAFTVFSALADGADQIVVREALNVLGPEQVSLVAVLPLALAEYRATLMYPETFDKLLTPDVTRVELPRCGDPEEAFESAGRYIVDHSDILIALWDGYPPDGRGGTAEIVLYARSRGTSTVTVPTARAEQPGRSPHCEPARENKTSSLAAADAAYRYLIRYNGGSTWGTLDERRVEDEQQRVLAVVDGSPIHWQCAIVTDWAVPYLVRADRLALRFQKRYYRASVLLYVLAALAVAAVASELAYELPIWVTGIEVVAMFALFSTYFVGNRLRLHEKWLGYRSLAEAFRSGLFITIAARARTATTSETSTNEPDGRSARISGSGLTAEQVSDAFEPWYQRAFSEVWRDRPEVEIKQSHAVHLRRILRDAWIDDQVQYHRAAAARARRANRRLTVLVVGLFLITLLAGLLHVLEVGGASLRHLFTLLAVTLPAAGASAVGVRDLRQYHVHEDRYTRTADHLEELEREMDARSGIESVRALARQTQTVIQTENHDWSSMVEFQKLELVL